MRELRIVVAIVREAVETPSTTDTHRATWEVVESKYTSFVMLICFFFKKAYFKNASLFNSNDQHDNMIMMLGCLVLLCYNVTEVWM